MGVRDLSGKRCLITGAASGIGRATALASARRGAELFLTDRNGTGQHGSDKDVRCGGSLGSGSRLCENSDAVLQGRLEYRGSIGLDVLVKGNATSRQQRRALAQCASRGEGL